VLVIAGPNGAGKTTFAREFLPKDARVIHVVNADLIASGLSPLRPELDVHSVCSLRQRHANQNLH
jgi:predicted ABC-type ATPase